MDLDRLSRKAQATAMTLSRIREQADRLRVLAATHRKYAQLLTNTSDRKTLTAAADDLSTIAAHCFTTARRGDEYARQIADLVTALHASGPAAEPTEEAPDYE